MAPIHATKPPQRQFLLTLSCTLRVVCGRANFTNLSRYCDLDKKIYRCNDAKPMDFEFIFRDSKQYLGLTHCQVRDSQKLNFHINSVLLTLNLLKVHWFFQQGTEQTEDQPTQPFSVALNSVRSIDK